MTEAEPEDQMRRLDEWCQSLCREHNAEKNQLDKEKDADQKWSRE